MTNSKTVPNACVLKTFDFQHTFLTYDPRQSGTCRIRIYEFFNSEGKDCDLMSVCKAGKTVIVASQNLNSSGSVTNFAEAIATEVCLISSERQGNLTQLPPYWRGVHSLRNTVWIEHYPPGTLLTPQQERFSIVTFQGRPNEAFSNPTWREIPRGFIEGSLLSRELD